MPRRRQPRTTRKRLLSSAFREIFRHGFRSADVESVLREAGVTKGALYHHFHSKRGLGYAMTEEVLLPWIVDRWLQPVESAVDPIEALIELARWGEKAVSPEGLALGCPLNNLAQEMSAVDDGFRSRLAAIYQHWRESLSHALDRAQQRGLVRPGVDTQTAATFIVAAWEGSIGLAKCEQSAETLRACRQGLEAYLRTLRPGP